MNSHAIAEWLSKPSVPENNHGSGVGLFEPGFFVSGFQVLAHTGIQDFPYQKRHLLPHLPYLRFRRMYLQVLEQTLINTGNPAKRPVQIMQLEHSEAASVQRRRILLVGAEPSVQGLISTFLVTMGWTCTVVQNKEEMPSVLQQKVFDAVVIELGRSEADAEKAIRWIEQIRPSLVGRILALNQGDDRQMLEFVERHDLIQLSQERLLPQLWAALEERVTSPRLRELVPRAMPVARLMFDSLRQPLPAGVRSLSTGGRQLAYQHERTIIDLYVDVGHGTGQLRLTGQVLAQGNKAKVGGLSVVLVDENGTLTRTTTNQFGEFNIQCKVPEDLSLEVRLGERAWVLVPLGKMD